MSTGTTESVFTKQREANDRDARIYRSLKKIKKKFLVMSGKGGVGKTSVSVNLSLALAAKGMKVGLVDIDIHGPDVPRMLGIKDKISHNIDQRLIPVSYSDNLKVISIDSLISNTDEAIIWRGSAKTATIKKFIGDVEWDDLDCLVIDSPPGTGDEPLTIAQTIRDAKAVIVTTPQEVSLADVRKSIDFCRNVHMDIFGIIENMSGFQCPHCAKEIALYGSGGGKKTAQASNNRFLGKIPFDVNIVSCGDNGISFLAEYPDSEITKAFQEIAEKMIKFE